MSSRSMSRSLEVIVPLALAMACAAPLAAQAPPRPPTPNDTLVSPEIVKDGQVVFRIYAPKASQVQLRGDWMEGSDLVSLQKDESGVWSATVGPLTPDYYSYVLVVDGVRTLDPKNPTIKQGIASVDNMFYLAGPESAFQDNRPVPHGEIRQVWYSSSTLGTGRRLHVYTPPGYDAGTTRYPVLYLLHGGGDDDSGWSTIGRAGFILDNLLAATKAVPMLIVMPNGSLPRPADLPAPTPGRPPDPAVRARLDERFTSELMKDVVPFIEARYRVRSDPASRAIAGLSMGGGQTLRVISAHADRFGYAAIWSAGLAPARTAEFEARAAAFLQQPDRVNRGFRLLSIAVGDKDFALEGSQNLAAVLKRHSIRFDMHVSGGGHTWLNWRRYLNDLLPRLFAGSDAGRKTN
jgi:enterochelin esterase-like enzyme